MSVGNTPLSGNTSILDQTNFSSSYASSPWDIRHNLTSGFNYDLPFGRGKKFGANINRVADAIVGGWQVNGVLTLRTGVPFTLSGTSCHGVWSKCMPDYVSGYTGNGNTAPAGGRSANQYFDIGNYAVAFSNQAAGMATGGNVGLQTMTGPPTKTMDFSIFKNFRLTERVHVQFRGEAINLGNFAILGLPDGNLGDSKAVGGNGLFGAITSAAVGTERHVQFALRLNF
jgi:hypothetical protein